MMKSDDLRRALRAIFTPDELMMPGWITYSGLDVLKNQMGGFYLMGLNPAVDDSNVLLGDCVPEQSATWSAFTDLCWKKHRGKECTHIELNPYQMRVLALAKALGIPINEIFATNAIFVASKNADELGALSSDLMWNKCWKIHQRFLAEMQPANIICLGDDCFALLESRAGEWKNVTPPTGSRWKAADATLPLFAGEALAVRVVRLPHPSWAHANGSAADAYRDYEMSLPGVRSKR